MRIVSQEGPRGYWHKGQTGATQSKRQQFRGCEADYVAAATALLG